MKCLLGVSGLVLLWVNVAIAEDNSSFILQIAGYFENYYRMVGEDKRVFAQEKLISEIKGLLAQSGFSQEQLNGNSLEDWEEKINQILKKNNQSIVLFIPPESAVINCWLGRLAQEKKETKNVWGREVEFNIKVMHNLTIKDYIYFLNAGKDALDAGSRGSTIYFNLDAYQERAFRIWQFFRDRAEEKRNKRYDSSKSNRLRKWLYHKTWANLYADCIKNSKNLEEAKSGFIKQATQLLKENSLFHEAGHIFTDKYLELNDGVIEEILAFLSELRYGPLPYESLETAVAAAYNSSMSNYNLAGREIISSFISYVKNEQKNKNPDYKKINVRGRNQTQMMENLFILTKEQIRSISEYIYKQKIREGRDHGQNSNYR